MTDEYYKRYYSDDYDMNTNAFFPANVIADRFIGLADKSTADGNGNNIVNTYATKAELQDASSEVVSHNTVFNDDGSIDVTYEGGKSEKTVFNGDGSITKTYYTNGVLKKTEQTTFTTNGNVKVSIT